jgi:hypothetical protein
MRNKKVDEVSDNTELKYHVIPNSEKYKGKPYRGELVHAYESSEFEELQSAIDYCLKLYDRSIIKFSVYNNQTKRVVFPMVKYTLK